MPRKQRTPLPLPERKALAIVARDALDAVIHQFHQASSGWESAAESSALGARQAMEAVSLLKSADRERDALAAANLAANKRIVELEQETDRLITQRDHWEEQVGDMAASAGCEEEFSNWHDHKDCVEERVAVLKTERDAARAELARLTTPRPIVEAPRDGTWVLLPFSTSKWDACRGPSPQYVTARWFAAAWADPNGALLTEPSHYLPLPDVKP